MNNTFSILQSVIDEIFWILGPFGVLLVLPIHIAIASLPVFASFEIYQLVRKQLIVGHPIKKGFFFGLLWGIIILIIGFANTSGEDTLGWIAFSPSIILSYLVIGFIVGAIYQKRTKVYLLSFFTKKTNKNISESDTKPDHQA